MQERSSPWIQINKEDASDARAPYCTSGFSVHPAARGVAKMN
jgi:hypothetical protein